MDDRARDADRVKRSAEELLSWLADHEHIAHRQDLVIAGFSPVLLRAAVRDRVLVMLRRAWFAAPDAARDAVTAARSGGRISCISLARERGWWIPEGAPSDLHLHFVPGSSSPGLDADWDGTRHWVTPIATPAGRCLRASVEDALAQIATCLEPTIAAVLWESASKVERLAPEYLRSLPWTSVAARELAEQTTGLADSGLEALLVLRIRRWGVVVRQQVLIAGRLVDALVGECLVIQVDGYEFHNSSAQRTSDIALDAELAVRGYTVLRFSYRQIVHEWDSVARLIRQALARGLHRAV